MRQEIARSAATVGRSDAVTLVAVTKTVSVEGILAAYRAGQRCFGENRVQEAAEKIATLDGQLPEAHWHLIGHLQSNKVGPATRLFSLVESVDTLRLARKLDTAAERLGSRLPILLEINVAGERSKKGFRPDELAATMREITALAHVRPQGLMTVAPAAENAEEVRWVFCRLRALRDRLRAHYGLPEFIELSMGMSGDFRVAVEEGATMVRIGRGIFGERPAARST